MKPISSQEHHTIGRGLWNFHKAGWSDLEWPSHIQDVERRKWHGGRELKVQWQVCRQSRELGSKTVELEETPRRLVHTAEVLEYKVTCTERGQSWIGRWPRLIDCYSGALEDFQKEWGCVTCFGRKDHVAYREEKKDPLKKSWAPPCVVVGMDLC